MMDKLFKVPPKVNSCLIFHDESKDVNRCIWAHAIFFMPEGSYRNLLDKLWSIRWKYNCMDKKFHFADISGRKLCAADGSKAIKEWIEIAVEALKTKNSIFNPPLECKLGIIFFDSSCNLSLYKGNKKEEKFLRYFETLLRMILKCCAHTFYDENNRLEIKGIITDGKPWHRPLNEMRILSRLMKESRDYVDIAKNAYIESIISDHKSNDCKDVEKAQLLQLTDLLLGSVIFSCFRKIVYGRKREKIIRPVKCMLDKVKRGKNFRYSSHYKTFVLSKARIEKGEWKFENVETTELIYENSQLQLLNSN